MRTLRVLTLLCTVTAARADSVSVEPVAASGGQLAVTRLVLHGEETTALQLDLFAPDGIDPAATSQRDPACTVNPGIDRWASRFTFLPHGCAPRVDCRGVRMMILTFDEAIFTSIPNGSWIAACAWRVAADAEAASYPLTCGLARGSTAPPDIIGTTLACDPGAIIVAAPGCLGDRNADGQVSVFEVLGVVRNVLDGCPQ